MPPRGRPTLIDIRFEIDTIEAVASHEVACQLAAVLPAQEAGVPGQRGGCAGDRGQQVLPGFPVS